MKDVELKEYKNAVVHHVKEEINPPKEKNKGGRPSKWRDDFCRQAATMSRAGINDDVMAQVFDIDIDTFYRWKKAKPKFYEAIREGKQEFDTKLVERSLLNRALGYDREEVTTVVREGREYEVKTVKKHYAGDTRAMQLWLNNRDPDRWRDKQEVKVTGTIDNRIEVVTKAEAMAVDNDESIGYIDTSDDVIEHNG